MFLLSSDEDTLTGLRLAGIEGALVRDKNDFIEKTAELALQKDIGILLVTRTLGEMFPERLVELKKNCNLLITEVPDMNSKAGQSDFLARYVRDAVGIVV